MGGGPQIFGDVDEVDQDVGPDVPAGGFCPDQVELMADSVDEDQPGPVMPEVAVACLGECFGDHVVGVVDQ